MPGEPVLISLAVLFALSILSDKILSRYLYMTAGLKPVDVKTYLWTRVERSDNTYRNRQNRLWYWMEQRSGYAKEFYTMSRYCDLTDLPLKLYFVGVMVILATRLYQYTWPLGGAMVALWAVFTLLGFRYGKYIESETADFFDSSRYKPYRPEQENEEEEVDSQEDLYEETPYAGPFEAADPETVQRRRFRRGYTQKLFVVAVVLVFLVLPMLSSRFLPSTSTPETEATPQPQTSQSPAESSYPPLFLDTNSVAALYNRLEELGYHPAMAVGQLSDTYPGMEVVDGLLMDEFEIHLEFIQLSDQDRAQQLYQRLKSEIVEQQVENPQITQEDRDGIILYAQETGDGYTAVVQTQDFVLYTYCSLDNTTWMKWFLYELGYLSTF